MKQIRFLPVVLGLLLTGASCVAPGHAPPRPPKPPKPPRPPHGAVDFHIPDTTFQRPTVAINS
ncbi:hypothetical protein [Chitinophaga sp. S165]|uniref:hypothetical protein n=1 Tax=Chitinophaga sp. S165 TaxID=2135462 RepID=UPI000D8E9404|nr:hypothetical protein [Chitinophaga sp. S165]PWV48950.1 hypothetical protein C7475_106196 [Chitinophaga sp. S165]